MKQAKVTADLATVQAASHTSTSHSCGLMLKSDAEERNLHCKDTLIKVPLESYLESLKILSANLNFLLVLCDSLLQKVLGR